MWKTIFTITLFIVDILLIAFLLFGLPMQKGIYVIYGWNDGSDRGVTEYTLTMYNLTTEKVETYTLKNKEEYDESFKYSHVRIYRNGLLGKWYMRFIPFEDILCGG